ncbi:MAG: ABC transporter permease [Acidimicrobiales bacterium]
MSLGGAPSPASEGRAGAQVAIGPAADGGNGPGGAGPAPAAGLGQQGGVPGANQSTPTGAPPTPARPAALGGSNRRRWEFLHYALRNKKLLFGVSIELFFILAAIFGPLAAPYSSAGDSSSAGLPLKDQCAAFFCASGMTAHPSAHHLFGLTYFGGDVLSIMLYSLRETYLVGFLGALFAGICGLALGFVAGWRGGWLDDVLQLFTNVVITMPALVLLIVIGAYMKIHSAVFEGVFIGVTSWPWVARAVRAQTFTLRERDFVDLARLSGKKGASIVVRDIAPNMASYLFLVFILLFSSAMLLSVSYDFLGLGPTNVVSLGDMMNSAMLWSALNLKAWWWFIPPGAAMTLIVFGLLISNIGLDEVFNPKLRES